MNDIQDFLQHYGVKGMKWGQRRGKSSSVARTRYTKPPARLSDAELKRRINRMETEKRYNELNAKTVSRGQKMVAEILTTVGKGTTTTLLSGATLYAAKKAIDKKFGQGTSAKVYPKKK